MYNVLIQRENLNLHEGWVVRADRLLHKKQQVMHKGSYDDCIDFVMQQFRNPLVGSIGFVINGWDERYGHFDNKCYRVIRK